MMRRGILRALTIGVVAFAAATAVNAQIIDTKKGDPAMAVAQDKARATLDTFFARLAKPQEGDTRFLVRISYPQTGGGTEHIWAKDVVRTGDQVSATIDNEPRNVPRLRKGQRVTVPVARVTDWLIEQSGKYHGAQSMRALLPKMGPTQAAEMRDLLHPE